MACQAQVKPNYGLSTGKVFQARHCAAVPTENGFASGHGPFSFEYDRPRGLAWRRILLEPMVSFFTTLRQISDDKELLQTFKDKALHSCIVGAEI